MTIKIFHAIAYLLILGASASAQTPASAKVTLKQAFQACEASVVQASADPLHQIGFLLEESDRVSRFRIATPEGALHATFLPPSRVVTSCVLLGRHPDVEEEFKGLWPDFVEWEEASQTSLLWFREALQKPGSVDLTDHTHAGFVVARCEAGGDGIVLSSQPVLSGTMRQILPNLEAEPVQRFFFQFSVLKTPPNRCTTILKEHKKLAEQ